MPLSIPLPAGAKIIINGAVVENSGTANITLTVHNRANILRDKDVLTQAEADTPAKEIYHSVQNAYLFELNREEWLSIAQLLMVQFMRVRPEAAPIVAHVRELLAEDKLYNALRASRRLIALEAGEPLDSVAHPGEPHLASREPPSRDPPSREGGAREAARGDAGAHARRRKREGGEMEQRIADLEKRIATLGGND